MAFLLNGTDLVEIESEKDMEVDGNQQDILKSLRKETGMNRAQFSDAFDIPVRSLEEWESGRRKIAPYNLRALTYYVRIRWATEELEGKKKEKSIVQWHPAFCAALRLDLAEYADTLIFEDEFQLSHKPLQIDCVVIRKKDDSVIENETAKHFKKINIFEYKSPDDKINIKTYYKVVAYAYLYMSLPQQKEILSPEDMTISLVRATKPEGFINQLEKIGIHVTEYSKGIYILSGATSFSTRLIISSELETEKHIALKALNRKISRQLYRRYIDYVQVQSGSMRELADVVMQPITQSNSGQISKWREENGMCEALREIMADEIEAMRAEAIEKGMLEGLKEGIEKGRKKGMKEGMKEGIKEGRQEGIKQGRQEGIKEGRQEGIKEGRQEGVANSIITMGKEFGLSTQEVILRIKNILGITDEKAENLYKMYS